MGVSPHRWTLCFPFAVREAGAVAADAPAVRSAASAGSPGVIFAVNDTGIAVPDGRRVRLSQDFAPADESATRRFGGLGPGLGQALSGWLGVLLGGRVEAESALGVGSTFTLWVPRQSPVDVVVAGGTWRSPASVGGAR